MDDEWETRPSLQLGGGQGQNAEGVFLLQAHNLRIDAEGAFI